MTELVQAKDAKVVTNILSDDEREQFEFYSSAIENGIRKGQSAKNEVISNVLRVIQSSPPLWREHYHSEEDYIRTELNIEVSSFWRNVKDNKNYLLLVSNTEDTDEQVTLSRMKGSAYRELRQLATDNKPVLKKGGESDEDYSERLVIKQTEDSELIADLWKEIYPRVKKFKEQSQTGIYPTGGYAISAKDITETAIVLQQVLEIPRLLSQGVSPSEIQVSDLEGRARSLEEVIEVSGNHSANVIDSLTQLGVSEALTEKLRRQGDQVRENLEKKYSYDKYEGKLVYEDGVLFVINEMVKYNLLNEWSDMLGRDVSISFRRPIAIDV